MLWNEEPPTDNKIRKHYLEIEDHLQTYKGAFTDEKVWAILSTRLSKILEIDYTERGDENSLIIERILILIRNILFVPPDPVSEKRPANDASIHDQVLWALQQSGAFDILLFISSSINERAYYMHALEILSFMLREQKASDLAKAEVQRSEMEKIQDEAELLAIRHRETNQKRQKNRIYSGARHSRFGGTYVLTSMKSISDNDLLYHKPLNKLNSFDFDSDKKQVKARKNTRAVHTTNYERRSAFSVRLFLKEFCVEFLNGAYNTLMYHVKDGLVRARGQAHDESYYLWALRFFMEFNRCYKFEVKLVSETMSLQSFHYVQQLLENYFDMMASDKKKIKSWSSRLHIALLAYKELLLTLCAMDRSVDEHVRSSSKIIKSNIFYVPEYRELVVVLLVNYAEAKMSDSFLRDLMETQHIFFTIFESFCSNSSVIMVQKKSKSIQKKKKTNTAGDLDRVDLNLNSLWEEISPQLSIVLENTNMESTGEDIVPFDAASDVPIDEQKFEAMKNIQKKLRESEFENATFLLRASREVWPENDSFGTPNMPPEEEFLALHDIFHADLGPPPSNDDNQGDQQEQAIHDEEEDEEDNHSNYTESDIKFEDFITRLCNCKIVKACGLALRQFESNPVSTNHAIIKLLHRIAFDCKMYVMLFQVSIFKTFQRIYAKKESPEHKELVKFSTYIIRQFIKVAETNKYVFIEALFWKTKSEAYDIEHGYGSYNERSRAALKAWTEGEEDELRRLVVEHGEKQLADDVVDWIVANLIDHTKSRRAVMKKLKEMYLLPDDYNRKRKSGTSKISRQWSAQEETQLRELFEHFKDSAADPVGAIIEQLDVKRARPKVVEKLLVMGLIHDRREVMKKRPQKSKQIENRLDSDSGESDSDGDIEANVTREPKRMRAAFRKFSGVEVTKLLVKLMALEMNDVLEWLKDSFSDAVEDFDSENDEGIPLVPIMEFAVDAMENRDFQQTLRALGITEPFDEQESYWRIPGDMPLEVLQSTVQLLQQALDDNLTLPEVSNEISENSTKISPSIIESDDDLSENAHKKVSKKRMIVIESDDDDEEITEENTPENSPKTNRMIIESDNDEEIEGIRMEDGDGEMPKNPDEKVSKRKKNIIESDDEEVITESKRTREDSVNSDFDKPSPKRGKYNLSSNDEN